MTSNSYFLSNICFSRKLTHLYISVANGRSKQLCMHIVVFQWQVRLLLLKLKQITSKSCLAYEESLVKLVKNRIAYLHVLFLVFDLYCALFPFLPLLITIKV